MGRAVIPMDWQSLLPALPPGFEPALPLLRRLGAMGYFERVRALASEPIENKHILDVGCGSGFYGPVFLALGAASYTGCDYKFDPESNKARDFTSLEITEMDMKSRDLMALFPGRVDLLAGGWESLAPDRRYDLVLMFMVTEHILDLDGAFASVARWLAPGGAFEFLHHNYAAWNGHHQPPRTIAEINPKDALQARYMDWNHLIHPPGPEDYTARKLNRVRLDELKQTVERHLTIQSWEELPMTTEQGRDRLIPEIQALLPEYSRRELLCQAVRCCARI